MERTMPFKFMHNRPATTNLYLISNVLTLLVLLPGFALPWTWERWKCCFDGELQRNYAFVILAILLLTAGLALGSMFSLRYRRLVFLQIVRASLIATPLTVLVFGFFPLFVNQYHRNYYAATKIAGLVLWAGVPKYLLYFLVTIIVLFHLYIWLRLNRCRCWFSMRLARFTYPHTQPPRCGQPVEQVYRVLVP